MTVPDSSRPTSPPRRRVAIKVDPDEQAAADSRRRVTIKVDPDERAAAERLLPAGRTMTGFLRACMRALAADRDALLTLLEPHWSERRAGRPRNPRSRRSRAGAYDR